MKPCNPRENRAVVMNKRPIPKMLNPHWLDGPSDFGASVSNRGLSQEGARNANLSTAGTGKTAPRVRLGRVPDPTTTTEQSSSQRPRPHFMED